MWKHQTCRIALLLVAFSILFRVIFAIPAFIDPYRISRLVTDSLEYIEFAKKIINCEELPGCLGFTRTPGYPLFLAFFYKLFVNPLGIILFVQILLTSIIILFAWKLPFMNHKSKVIFSILYIINFNIALYAAHIMSDTLFMVVVFLGIMSIIYYLNLPILWRLFPITSFFAIATWIRPIGLYFFPIVSLFLLVKTRKFSHFFLMLFLYFALLSPWYIRNYVRFHSIVFCTVANNNIAFYEAAATLSEKENIPIDSAVKIIQTEVGELCDTTNLGKYFSTCSKVGIKYLMKEPLIYSKIRITGFLNTLLLPLPMIHTFFFFNNKPPNEIINEMNLKGGISQEIIGLVATGKIVPAMALLIKEKVSKFPWYIIIISIFATIYHLFVLITAMLSLKSNKLDVSTKLLLLLTIFYFTFIPGAVVQTRFRVPIEPYLLIFSAIKLSDNI